MSDQTVINVGPKPGKVQVMEIVLLISGILNVIAGITTICGSLFLCLPIGIIPAIIGAFEIVYAAKLLNGKPVNASDIKTIAIFEVASIIGGNVPTLVAGILNLVFLDDREVKEYLG
jgi:hypothetical protein